MDHGIVKLLFLIGSFALIPVAIGLMGLHARKRLRELRCDPPLELQPTKPNKTFPKLWVLAGERIAQKDGTPPDEPPLDVGDQCIFISETGPIMLVVDANETHVITSWDDGWQERKFSRTVVRRWKPDELVKPRKVPA
jgi:hypothetical protein